MLNLKKISNININKQMFTFLKMSISCNPIWARQLPFVPPDLLCLSSFPVLCALRSRSFGVQKLGSLCRSSRCRRKVRPGSSSKVLSLWGYLILSLSSTYHVSYDLFKSLPSGLPWTSLLSFPLSLSGSRLQVAIVSKKIFITFVIDPQFQFKWSLYILSDK